MKNIFIKILLVINLAFTGFLAINQYLNRKIELYFSDKIVKARGLVILDSDGVERVLIGANLPDPQGHGNRFAIQSLKSNRF